MLFPGCNVVIVLISIALVVKGLPTNNSTVLKYAKVSHFGSVQTGRSNSGQTPWTHRSDVRVVKGQNLQSNPGVVYHYAIPKKSIARTSDGKSDLPGIGEVEERFNPRPYFQYKEVSPSKQPVAADTTFSSFPVFNKPSDTSRTNSYNSPYNSYNPPQISKPSSQPQPIYPPNNIPPPQPMLPTPSTTLDSYAAPPEDSSSADGPYSYKPSNIKSPMPPPIDDSPRPSYIAPEMDHAPPEQPEEPPRDHDDDDDDELDTAMNGDETSDPQGPPKDFHSYRPHKEEENVYFPPGDNGHQEVILDHPPPGWKDPEESKNRKPPKSAAPPPPPPPPPAAAPVPDMAEGDLNPPPSDAGKFPSYLYSGGDIPHDFGPYDFDHHHVYHEVEHPTTTTEAPEERVNKAHYSYYYLGRKLWYVPLYFSIYFIIYVTILILKSIARHKIQFKHDFADHYKSRNARQMDLENLNDLHRNVSVAIDNVKKRIPFVAM